MITMLPEGGAKAEGEWRVEERGGRKGAEIREESRRRV